MLHSCERDVHPQDLIGALKTANGISANPQHICDHRREPRSSSVSTTRTSHLKDGQDAAVSDVALVRVVLRVAQTSEDLKSLAGTNPRSL